jgi:anti-sigma-K factor RskA
MLKNSPQALAVAVWDPGRQEGVLNVQNLPALATNQDYQLWLVDPQYPNPVDGGVFSVEPASGTARLQFKAKQPVGTVNAFAVTRERKGGVAKAQGPFVLLGK